MASTSVLIHAHWPGNPIAVLPVCCSAAHRHCGHAILVLWLYCGYTARWHDIYKPQRNPSGFCIHSLSPPLPLSSLPSLAVFLPVTQPLLPCPPPARGNSGKIVNSPIYATVTLCAMATRKYLLRHSETMRNIAPAPLRTFLRPLFNK